MSENISDRRADILRRADKERSALLAVLDDAATVQEKLLLSIVRRNAESQFGRDHRFASVRSIADFQQAVPIRVHEEFEPWLEATIAGRSHVLSDEDPFVYFSSSGTTGREKRIPVTASYLRESFLPFYFAGLATILEQCPDALHDDNSVLNLWQDPYSPTDRTADGTPHIGLSQLDYRGLGEDLAVGLGNRAAWSRLPDSFDGVDPLQRTYLRLRIAAEYDIRCVFAINPAVAHALPTQLALWWPRIVRDLRDGTLDGQPFTAPNKARADQIENLANWFGTIRPKDIWPRLNGVVVWSNYIGGMYLRALGQDYGPGVRIIPAPIGSSEGPLAAPIDRHPSASPLMTTAVFYEFIPADEEITSASRTLLAHEVVPGNDYHVVLTRVGGIHRCATRDIVRVVEFVGGTPRIEYGGRQGELAAGGARLREDQAVRAMHQTATASGMQVENLTWRLDDGSDPPRHEVAVAFRHDETPRDVARFERLLDTFLSAESPSYAAARRIDAIGPARVHPAPVTAFFSAWLERVRAGQRPPRVKDRVFDPKSSVWSELLV
ncbi:GH3 auxin-responsive promoter family protein [Nocardia sp. NPDC051052]|uniref:GH3 family domain-containing protein n=1 Tax=Nocardia sp. NPDC051052 TaxID=3364322 RepID=UPI0037B2FEC9